MDRDRGKGVVVVLPEASALDRHPPKPIADRSGSMPGALHLQLHYGLRLILTEIG